MSFFEMFGFYPGEGGKKKDVAPKKEIDPKRKRFAPGRAAGLLVLGGVLLGTRTEAAAPSIQDSGLQSPRIEQDSGDRDSLAPDVEMEAGSQAGEKEKGSFHFEGLHSPIFNTETGKIEWVHLLDPVYLPVSREAETPEQIRFFVPNQYARTFDTGDLLDPQDYESAQDYIAGSLRDALGDNLHGLSWDETDYRAKHPVDADGLPEVKSILALGGASPEGPEVGSVKPGEIEDENLDLGELRGISVTTMTLEALKQMGVRADSAAIEILGDEQQFSSEEYAMLEKVAREQGLTGRPEEVVYKLISQYNRGEITNEDTLSVLDQTVASKRGVEIEITLKDGGKDTYLIPASWLPLLLLPLAFRRRKPGEGEKVKPPEKTVEPPVKREKITEEPPGDVEETEVVVKNVEADLAGNFEFYQSIVDRYSGEEDPDVNEMTHDILDLWTANDNDFRTKAGLPAEPHHRTRPRQVFYANLHARALKELILDARKHNEKVDRAWDNTKTRERVKQVINTESDRLKALKKE